MARKDEQRAQAAVLPVRVRKDRIEVLLVTSIGSRRWILPKGHVGTGWAPRAAATREAYEEAGVLGRVSAQPIGAYRLRKSATRPDDAGQVEVFLMQVEQVKNDWPEKKHRRRRWMTPSAAAAQVAEPRLARMIKSVSGHIRFRDIDEAA